MKSSPKILHFVFLTLLLFGVTACADYKGIQPIKSPYATYYPSLIPATPAATTTPSMPPRPTIQAAITASPDQLARWGEYERALAMKLLSHLPPEEILCEWEILGQSLQEVYVWAFCLGLPPAGRSEKYAPVVDVPVIIHLELDGSVESVELPRDGGLSYSEGIRNIFPKDVQQKIFSKLFHYAELADHARARREHHGPPLIVLLATLQP